ncbi:M10 family metallopeptidase C-terminal domain-containing protein [Paracoccus sp. 11-3]|uniref:M10 family metallopeptidase C-terminal domain-containing protein n=1 Tax=Paracoccus amoyensis TaxID=2760093 RepID=A0A926JE44_9RHOB|nr:calcium-binding protein [Paracoccus amoyensis]MBC9248469.1 M10 family metallopeptidase C-terminal domain-containing protein [Paracoccus amoyensis]
MNLDATDGGYRKTILFGSDLGINSNDRLNDGTVSIIADAYSLSPNGFYRDNWIIAGVNIDAQAVTRAANTRSITDDTALIRDALSKNDKFTLGVFNDSVDGYAGNDNINGGHGNDTLVGGVGNDTLLGGAGNDVLTLDAGNDRVLGNEGSDTLMVAGNAAVTIDLRRTDAQDTGRGFDTIRGIENVVGAKGSDVLSGNRAMNWIEGGNGSDRLDGRAGDDRLAGGLGVDFLTGGAGRDQFIFTSAGEMGTGFRASDFILDFQDGRDLINLDAVDGSVGRTVTRFNAAGFSGTGEPEVTFKKRDLAGTDNDLTVVQLDRDGDGDIDGYIRIKGLFDLTADDFLL